MKRTYEKNMRPLFAMTAEDVRKEDERKADERDIAFMLYQEEEDRLKSSSGTVHDILVGILAACALWAIAFLMRLAMQSGIFRESVQELGLSEGMQASCLLLVFPAAAFGLHAYRRQIKKYRSYIPRIPGQAMSDPEVDIHILYAFLAGLEGTSMAMLLAIVTAALHRAGLPHGTSLLPLALPVSCLLYLIGEPIFWLIRRRTDRARAEELKKARKEAVTAIESALAAGATVMCGRQKVRAIMPSGAIKDLPLERSALCMLPKGRIKPGDNVDAMLVPASEAALEASRYRELERWAKDVLEDAERKCGEIADANEVIDARGRVLTVRTKDGGLRQVCFEENVYTLFDNPKDGVWRKDGIGERLKQKLIPSPVLISLKLRDRS